MSPAPPPTSYLIFCHYFRERERRYTDAARVKDTTCGSPLVLSLFTHSLPYFLQRRKMFSELFVTSPFSPPACIPPPSCRLFFPFVFLFLDPSVLPLRPVSPFFRLPLIPPRVQPRFRSAGRNNVRMQKRSKTAAGKFSSLR